MSYLEDKELPFNPSEEEETRETFLKLADQPTIEVCSDFLLEL